MSAASRPPFHTTYLRKGAQCIAGAWLRGSRVSLAGPGGGVRARVAFRGRVGVGIRIVVRFRRVC